MAKVNMLIMKVYLLAGMVIAANMFIVNEVKASKEENKNAETNEIEIDEGNNVDDKNFSFIRILNTASGFVLYWENTINFATGLVVSGGNNYFKWWNYNQGRYCKLGCYGWRSGRFLKDIFQFDINLNIGRGVLWLIPGVYGIIRCFFSNDSPPSSFTARQITMLIIPIIKKKCKTTKKTALTVLFLISLLQGFVSAPLAIHISIFSIAISLDSILWASVVKIFYIL